MSAFLFMLILLPLVVPCLIAALLMAWMHARRQRARVLVRLLATIIGQNLPLPEALRAAAAQERGVLGRILDTLALVVAQGHSLSSALSVAYPTCPGDVRGAILGAERSGALPSVLRQLAADRRRTLPAATASPAVPYFVTMLGVAPMIIAFLMVSVVPRFHEIFLDFGLALPRITVILIDVTHWLSRSAALPLAAFGGPIFLLCWFYARHFLVRAPEKPQWHMWLWDAFIWRLPLIGRVAAIRALAKQLPLVHAALRCGHDLPAALRQAGCVGVVYPARERLWHWADRITAGADPADAARQTGLPAPVVTAVRGAGDALPLRLEYLASYYRGVGLHWERVLASLAAPLLTFAWALVVGFVALALFMPLVKLINGVAEQAT